MIISSFNRYFEKHGRKTYIALGIIISVIFVFSLGGGMDSCGYRTPGLKSFGKMYGKTLKSKEIMHEMRKTDIGYVLRTGMSLGNHADSAMLQMTLGSHSIPAVFWWQREFLETALHGLCGKLHGPQPHERR